MAKINPSRRRGPIGGSGKKKPTQSFRSPEPKDLPKTSSIKSAKKGSINPGKAFAALSNVEHLELEEQNEFIGEVFRSMEKPSLPDAVKEFASKLAKKASGRRKSAPSKMESEKAQEEKFIKKTKGELLSFAKTLRKGFHHLEKSQ